LGGQGWDYYYSVISYFRNTAAQFEEMGVDLESKILININK
jgi:hypothetical protein